MKTLKIEDLSQNDGMDRTEMAQVSGGRLPQVMVDLIQNVHDDTHLTSGGRDEASRMFQQLLNQ